MGSENIFEGISVKKVRSADIDTYLQILREALPKITIQPGACLGCSNTNLDRKLFVELSPRFDSLELKRVHELIMMFGYDGNGCIRELIGALADSNKSSSEYDSWVYDKENDYKEIKLRAKRKVELAKEIPKQLELLQNLFEELKQLAYIPK